MNTYMRIWGKEDDRMYLQNLEDPLKVTHGGTTGFG